MKTATSTWARIALGAFLILYALNQFLHVFPSGYGKMPDDARQFIDSIVTHLPFLYILEIVIGVLLVLNRWTPAILIMLIPLSVSFLVFMQANQDFTETWPALLVAVLNLYLLLTYKEKYKPLFE